MDATRILPSVRESSAEPSPPGAEARLRYRLLGPLEVRQGDQWVSVSGRVAQRTLARLLLSAGYSVPTRQLVRGVWEDNAPDSAGHQIRKAIAALRRMPSLGRALVTADGGYRVEVEPGEVDVTVWRTGLERCRRALESGDLPAAEGTLNRTLPLWRGGLLGGDAGAGLEAEAVLLTEERFAALETWSRLRFEAAGARAVVELLQEELARWPYQERLWALLLEALNRDGRRAEALFTYARLRARLRDELGTEPGPQLTSLHEQILRQDVPPPPGGRPPRPAAREREDARSPEAPPWLVDVLAGQEPRPAYLIDHAWDVLACNRSMTRWFPWSSRPGANLMRWVLLDPEAREQLDDWNHYSRIFLGMLAQAQMDHPGDPRLAELAEEVCTAVEVDGLCLIGATPVSEQEGRSLRLRLPHITPEPLQVVTHLLVPQLNPRTRLVILEPTG